MKSKELWAQYQHYTRDLTEHSRKLGFGGSALCWLFKDANFEFPVPIYLALLWFVLFFVFDILQGLLGALFIRHFTENAEQNLWNRDCSIEGDIDKPRWVDVPAFTCFILKAVFLIIGFTFVAAELFDRVTT